MKNIITFGEIMLRLSPPGFQRFGQARAFEVIYGGGEANVASTLSQFGYPTEFVTRVPTNDIAEACISYLRSFNVGIQHILRGGERLGIYYLENGAVQRGSKVVYDRANSSFSTITPGMIDWDIIFKDAGWFHWTGITPAVSAGAAAVCLEAVQAARKAGVKISCDLNFRKNLWKWGKKAGEVMPDLVSYADIVIGNEEDAEKVFGIKAPDVDVSAGKVHADAYRFVCDSLVSRFPNVKTVAITLRGSQSASHNTWSGVLFDSGKFFQAPQFDITHIVDRVGGGGCVLRWPDLWINHVRRRPKSPQLRCRCFMSQAYDLW